MSQIQRPLPAGSTPTVEDEAVAGGLKLQRPDASAALDSLDKAIVETKEKAKKKNDGCCFCGC